MSNESHSKRLNARVTKRTFELWKKLLYENKRFGKTADDVLYEALKLLEERKPAKIY